MNQVARIMTINNLDIITPDAIEAAHEVLVVGAATQPSTSSYAANDYRAAHRDAYRLIATQLHLGRRLLGRRVSITPAQAAQPGQHTAALHR